MKKKFEIEVEIIEKYYHHLINQNNILKEIKSYRVLHGGGFRYEFKGKEAHSPIKEVRTEIVYSYDEIINFDLQSFCTKLFELVNMKIEKLQRLMYDELLVTTEMTGNKVNVRGSDFNPDAILEMLEKIEIRFDENNEPILPQLHVSTEMFNKIKDFSFTPEQEKLQKEIIDNKRKLWLAKKRYRKLSYIN